eukprot:CAMPEP_0194183768 /NCGR_PEP_ID=MMETSP0154-20130528/33687_1 /TAXON_ID=1049557 /ORGANISM="Thalassiothrix antarctica, Strain L6-D1" /LENGTH=414 /DNA_ID=CAMNT_0038900937 /DNA_START=179 /DNA_END=1424 /DNA_ORIENTATION=-
MKQTIIALFFTILFHYAVSIDGTRTHVYRARVNMYIGWFDYLAEDETQAAMTLPQLSHWSNLIAPYLQLTLSNYERDSNTTDIIDVAVMVNDQTTQYDAENSAATVGIQCTIQVWYIGTEAITDLHEVFEETLESENGVEAILRDVVLVRPGSEQIQDFYINITSHDRSGGSSDQLYTIIPIFNYVKAQRGLIVACTFLVFTLFFVSGVVIWMAGGCPIIYACLRNPIRFANSGCNWFGDISIGEEKSKADGKKSDVSKPNRSYRQDRKTDRKLLPRIGESSRFDSVRFDDDTTTASGVLGAIPSYDTVESSNSSNGNEHKRIGYSQGSGLPPGTLPVGFTPKRSVFREQDCDDSQIMTPMSTNTDYSANGGRVVPLGIAPSAGGTRLTYRTSPDKNKKQGSKQEAASPGIWED